MCRNKEEGSEISKNIKNIQFHFKNLFVSEISSSSYYETISEYHFETKKNAYTLLLFSAKKYFSIFSGHNTNTRKTNALII